MFDIIRSRQNHIFCRIGSDDPTQNAQVEKSLNLLCNVLPNSGLVTALLVLLERQNRNPWHVSVAKMLSYWLVTEEPLCEGFFQERLANSPCDFAVHLLDENTDQRHVMLAHRAACEFTSDLKMLCKTLEKS